MEKRLNIQNSKYDAETIAKFFIWKAHQQKRNISNKKLQKLLYYAQSWYLVNFNEKLFKEDIEAWIHGPVVVDIYHKYKKYGFSPITEKVESPTFDKETQTFLDEVWSVYGKLDANTLEDLSHSEQPWQETRANIEEKELSSAVIPVETIYLYYSKKLDGAKK
jgi:uncharacterized phage-associated protein